MTLFIITRHTEAVIPTAPITALLFERLRLPPGRPHASSDAQMLARHAPNIGIDDAPTSSGFSALLVAFQHAGTTRADRLAAMLESPQRSTGARLSQLLESGEVFAFHWRKAAWIPMFQLDTDYLRPRPGSVRVLKELAGCFDSWRLACWFANHNDWLDGRRPVDLIEIDLQQVLAAARADRFVVLG